MNKEKRTLHYSVILIIALTIVFRGCKQHPEPLTKTTLAHWQFKQADSAQWRTADVPGVVHTDLMSHGLIPNPWVGLNEKKVQWIEDKDWQYRTTFELPPENLETTHIDLVFEGLDTYADVTLNDSLILQADNMFRRWRADVTNLLNKGSNELLITFRSPIEVNKPKLKELDYELPAGSESVKYKVSPFTRKAPYHFGWDWGPRLVTAGIWRPVYLESWDAARIANVHIRQNTLSDSLANLTAVVEIESNSNQQLRLEVLQSDTLVNLSEGTNTNSVNFSISDPKRWWPNGWGEPYLYEIPVSISKNNVLLDTLTENIGLRTVELVQKEDSIGKSFYFKINGEPLFAKGANYIPQSHFLPSVEKSDYERLIADVKKANMNMLRVWGGGIYENDIFYDLCDKHGILVWQDFMFAGSMYPGNSAFVKNVEKEIIDNVKRLRNHPSIILWNGNNEIEVAWKNWGWQEKFGYSAEDSAKIWHDYLALFHKKIPALLDTLDDRPYTTTSPLSNWGRPENFNYGSMHYWGVWHGQDNFEDYYENVGRFMSEYGFQSFPDMETIAYFADSTDWNLESEVMRHHQKSYVGNDIIVEQIHRYFNEPDDFEDFVIKSQRTQAKGMQMAIDAHRLNKGYCGGSLYWQLNDCWPGPSWSSIDVFGRKKIFYDRLKTLYAPIALIPLKEEDTLSITLVNDRLKKFEGKMKLILHIDSNKVRTIEKPISSGKNSKKNVYKRSISKLLTGIEPGSARLEIKLLENNKKIFERSFSF